MSNRAKALFGFAWPVLVFCALAALLLFVERGPHGALNPSAAPPTSKDGWLSATSEDASIQVTQRSEGATTVTTYTVTGKY
jgi:hypothetical protein